MIEAPLFFRVHSWSLLLVICPKSGDHRVMKEMNKPAAQADPFNKAQQVTGTRVTHTAFLASAQAVGAPRWPQAAKRQGT